jgi:hypothetical protein
MRITIVVLTILIASLTDTYAESTKSINLDALSLDLKRNDESPEFIRSIMYLPTEFFRAATSNSPQLPSSSSDSLCDALDRYTIFWVLEINRANIPDIVSTTRENLVNKLSLTIGEGEAVSPLSEKEISKDAQYLLELMQQMFEQSGGVFSQGEFLCFKGVSDKGKRLFNPTKKGFLSLNLRNSTYKWRLPLGSLLPPKYDKNTGEEFPGNYMYNPFTGETLRN